MPPLPPYPITWTAIAVCLETAGPVFDLKLLVQEANERSRPALSFSIVDAQELIDEVSIKLTLKVGIAGA